MQIPAEAARPIVDILGADDFADSTHVALYRIIDGLIRGDQPHDYVMVAHEIDSHPVSIDNHQVPLRQRLIHLIGAATYPERARITRKPSSPSRTGAPSTAPPTPCTKPPKPCPPTTSSNTCASSVGVSATTTTATWPRSSTPPAAPPKPTSNRPVSRKGTP